MIDVESFHRQNFISDEMRRHIGGVALIAGSIEFWSERVLWNLKQENPSGLRPSTDTQQISGIIQMIESASLTLESTSVTSQPGVWPPETEEFLPPGELPLYQSVIKIWCPAATQAFECRNTIMHGVMLPGEEGLSFLKGTHWHGERRKRNPASFHASQNTLMLLEKIFLELLHTITLLFRVSESQVLPSEVFTSEHHRALETARSQATELNHLTELAEHEKY